MASYTRPYVALLLTALLASRSVLAIPTPVQDLDTRATSTETPSPNITPEIIDHGPLDQAEIDALLANLTATSKIQARQTSNVTVGTSKNGAFLSYINGIDLPGETAQCPEFMVEGPILGIDAAMGSSNIRSLKLTSISGNTTDITGLENIADPAPGAFTFGANERITEFVVLESGLSQVFGFTFKTDAGQEYKALSTAGLEANPANNITYNSLPVGSGIIARIYGTKCDVGIISAFGIDFLDDLASISITNMTYSGFTNNIAPGGEGSLLNVGSQILDNRNSSVQQQMTLTTSNAVTKSHTVSTTSNWNVGNSVAIKAGASIPFIAQSEVTTTVNWQVGGASDDSETTAETRTSTSAFQLNCPAKKFCVASATFQTFKLDVNLEATFTAETKSGNKYNWVQSGTYKGSDSLSMKLTVDEADNAS